MYYLYRFVDKNNNILYVGKSINIKDRLIYHFGARGHLPKECYDRTEKIEILELNTKTEMNIKELYYISKYQAEYNTLDKNENIYIEELESNDIWKEYALENEVQETDKFKIEQLKEENRKLKETIKENKEHHFKELKELYGQMKDYYELKEVLRKYEETTGLKWKRKGYDIKLYS